MATSRLCSIPDCGKPHYGHGYCRRHYRRTKAHGDPLAGGVMRDVIPKWLEDHSTFAATECLEWPFSRTKKGYGQVKFNGNSMGAHRAMCIIAHGPPPPDKNFAAHSCNNGHLGCVNPSHLSWKTPKENKADMIACGASPRGTKHPKNKLSEREVMEIRRMEGTATRKAIGDMFGVNLSTVAAIHFRRSWGWLP